MDDQLVSEVLGRLDRDADIEGTAKNLVVGALLGRLDDALDGTAIESPVTDGTSGPAPVRAFLESVEVTGFRGIGPTCELRLSPGPGLTLVVGRNGSGKSSIAEAAEFAMTGDSLRWAGKSVEWRAGWQNLHGHSAPEIAVALRVEGEREPRTVRTKWGDDRLESAKTAVTVPGRGRHTLDSLGWTDAVRTFRPFLPYKELSTISEGRPVDRFNALAPMLGMESLREPVESLRQARLSSDKHFKSARAQVSEVVRQLEELSLESPDERIVAALEALSSTRDLDEADARGAAEARGRLRALSGAWDLEKIEALITGADPSSAEQENALVWLEGLQSPDLERIEAAASGLREAAERTESLRGSDAERARKLARLLEAALEVHEQHGDSNCPVCGRDNGLHSRRVEELRVEIQRLRSEAREADDARRELANARKAARNAVGTTPLDLAATGLDTGVDMSALTASWEEWLNAPEADLDLASHLVEAGLRVAEATETVRSAAGERRQQLADEWRPIAESLAEMLPAVRLGQLARGRLRPVRAAEQWLKTCEATIRDERFDAVRTQVKEVWETLAVGSNVSLEDVRLGAKRVEMEVTVDGDDSAALGVMSQGELHALALSLFIPRVQFDESPFGFAVLDDPVQAMDPVRVDGLARVLHSLAKTRQVVIFTHDDRLPSAVRRLQMPATIWSVTRRPQSGVELKKSLDPAKAAIEDARALELSGGIPEEVRRRVVPNMCRHAIEAACFEAGRRRLLAKGMSHSDFEEAWTVAARLRPRIAIALYGDAGRTGEVHQGLINRWGRRAADTVRSCNKLSHGSAAADADLKGLIRSAESLAEKIAAL